MAVDTKLALTIAAFFLGGIVALTLSGIVVNDYNSTLGYTSETCNGHVKHSDIHTSLIGCARGKAIAEFGTSNRSVELYYPEVNWLLVCRKRNDVQSWLSSMGTAETFDCLVDRPEDLSGLPDGVRQTFDQVGGWIAMMVLSALWLLVCTGILLYVIWYECCGKNERSLDDATRWGRSSIRA